MTINATPRELATGEFDKLTLEIVRAVLPLLDGVSTAEARAALREAGCYIASLTRIDAAAVAGAINSKGDAHDRDSV